MKTLLKLLGSTVLVVVLLTVIAMAALVMFVSPNRFKPIITAQALKYTGREVIIAGDLSWRFFPTLGVKVGRVSISNPAGFKQPLFGDIASATLGVKLLPLLHGKIESSGITLTDVNIYLQKNAKITIQNIEIEAHFQQGMLTLNPVTAHLYQGTLQNNTQINFNTPTPKITMQTSMHNIQVEPLLKDSSSTSQKITVSGAANIELQITTTGRDANTLVRNLNGNSQFNLRNGALEGVDLGYLVDNAYALIKQNSTRPRDTGKTSFGNLTGMPKIHNGIVSNTDLLMDSPRFLYRGKGNINLVNDKINYHLQIAIKKRDAAEKNNLQDLYGLSIPILVNGNLNDPSIRLDSSMLAQVLAKQQIKNVKIQLQEQIKDKIKGQAGDFLQNLLGN